LLCPFYQSEQYSCASFGLEKLIHLSAGLG
jgi:hypothetical protein